MKRLLWILAATAALAGAQSKGPEPGRGPQRSVVVEVKNGDVNRIAQVVSSLGATVRADPTLHVIAVGGDINTVNEIEAAIKRMDVPMAPVPNVELTVYFLYGAAQETAGASVPQDLDATVKQLRALFPYKSYRVVDSTVLRGRDGEFVQFNGIIPDKNGGSYSFNYLPLVATGPPPRMVRLSRLQVNIMNGNSRGSINTDLDTREGQKTVLGKSNVSGTEDALIVVVTPKVE